MFKIESWVSKKNSEPEVTKENQGVVIYTANVKTKQGKANLRWTDTVSSKSFVYFQVKNIGNKNYDKFV